MLTPWTSSEILTALEGGSLELEAWFLSIPESVFFRGDSTRWSPGHHIAHLGVSHRALIRPFRAVDRASAHATGASRNFNEVRDAYRVALAEAPVAMLRKNPFSPALPQGTTKSQEVARYAESCRGLRQVARGWSESDLDVRAIPHPLMGELSGREMLLFMLYHDQHHLAGVQAAMADPTRG